MKVIDTNDSGLRTLIHDFPQVIAKFTAADCPVCQQLAPHFEGFSTSARYQDIAFLRLDSDQNPVARQLMAELVVPFFAAYSRGRLLECNSFTTEAEVQAMLERLLAQRKPAES